MEGAYPQQTKPTPTLQQLGAPAPPKTPSAADKIRFKLSGVIIEGNTVFSTAQLEEVFKPSLNKTISLADLQALVDLITKKYRSAGYVLSRAILPPQTIKKGMVHVQVIEGFISKIKIEGNPGIAQSVLEKYAAKVIESRPLQIHVLEHNLLLMNDVPGVAVKAVLTPSKTIAKSADLTLVVDRHKFDGYVAYDNYGTRYLGPNEVTVSGNLYSVLRPGDSHLMQFVEATKPGQMQYAYYSYLQPIGGNGMKGGLSGTYAKTQPGFVLDPFDVIGRNVAFTANLIYPFIRSRNINFNFEGKANYQNVTSTILASPFYQDRIRSLTLGGHFDQLDTLRGFNTAAVSLTHGFDILGANFHFYQSRPEGQSKYTRTDFTFARLQSLGQRFSLYGLVSGQYSMEPLLATEQYGFGGPDIGRGYDPSEIIGDDGLSGKLELRMDTAPELKALQTIQYYIFYDAGKIWNRDTVDLPPQLSGTSTGFGMRITFMSHLSGNFYIAKPLTLPVATQVILGRNGNAARAFFQLVAQF